MLTDGTEQQYGDHVSTQQYNKYLMAIRWLSIFAFLFEMVKTVRFFYFSSVIATAILAFSVLVSLQTLLSKRQMESVQFVVLGVLCFILSICDLFFSIYYTLLTVGPCLLWGILSFLLLRYAETGKVSFGSSRNNNNNDDGLPMHDHDHDCSQETCCGVPRPYKDEGVMIAQLLSIVAVIIQGVDIYFHLPSSWVPHSNVHRLYLQGLAPLAMLILQALWCCRLLHRNGFIVLDILCFAPCIFHFHEGIERSVGFHDIDVVPFVLSILWGMISVLILRYIKSGKLDSNSNADTRRDDAN